jgi:hypothetical protein
MAVDSERATQRALSKLSGKYDTSHEHLVELVRAICEALCEEVPHMEDVGGLDPSLSHQ